MQKTHPLKKQGQPFKGCPCLHTIYRLITKPDIRELRPLRSIMDGFLICEAAMDEASTRWDEFADDHVFLQTEERVSCGTDCRACQNLDGVLE